MNKYPYRPYKQNIKATPIGFLMGQGQGAGRPDFTPSPPQAFGPPMPPYGGFPPGSGGPSLPMSPPGGDGGIGGILKGLMNGQGDIQGFINNAQKMIGIVNQIGPIVKNISPMLGLLKGLAASSTTDEEQMLTDIEEQDYTKAAKKRRSKKTARQTRAKRRNLKKRKKAN